MDRSNVAAVILASGSIRVERMAVSPTCVSAKDCKRPTWRFTLACTERPVCAALPPFGAPWVYGSNRPEADPRHQLRGFGLMPLKRRCRPALESAGLGGFPSFAKTRSDDEVAPKADRGRSAT
jgi:hypothetical protein